MIFDLIFSFDMRTDTGLHNILSNDSSQSVGNGERGINPTVSVHYVQWDLINNTINGVSNILPRRDQKREGNQYDHRRFVMQAEYVIVDANLV